MCVVKVFGSVLARLVSVYVLACLVCVCVVPGMVQYPLLLATQNPLLERSKCEG